MLSETPSGGSERDRDDAPNEPSDRRRLEIVHESLLTKWPRLVRWRTQDEDGAQLRDQLRQAARLWRERGRPDDLLWNGTSFKEYELWRERYAGGLSTVEEAFVGAMTGHARRRQRRRRIALASIVGLLAIGLSVFASLWRQSETARERATAAEQQAVEEARRAEAGELLSLGRLRLEGHPTAALAYALASLERADTEPARRFVVEALWRGPMVSVVTSSAAIQGLIPVWSPDGGWLAMTGLGGLVVQDRESREIHRLYEDVEARPVGFTTDGSRLVTHVFSGRTEAEPFGEIHVWALPDAERVSSWTVPGLRVARLFDRRLLTLVREDPTRRGGLLVQERSLDGGPVRNLGRPTGGIGGPVPFTLDGERGRLFTVEDGRLLRRPLDALEGPPRVLGRHQGVVDVNTWANRIVTTHESGAWQIRDPETGHIERTLAVPPGARGLALDLSGRFFATAPGLDGTPLPAGSFRIVDLEMPAGAEPIRLLDDELDRLNHLSFHPRLPMLASGHHPDDVHLWNLAGPRSIAFAEGGGQLAFTPDGRLVSVSGPGVHVWPLWTDLEAKAREVWSEPTARELDGLSVSPDGRNAVVIDVQDAEVVLVPLDGAPAVEYRIGDDPTGLTALGGLSFAPDGRRVAMAYGVIGGPQAASIRILDLENGQVRVLRPDDASGACVMVRADIGPMQLPSWMADGRLISYGALGLRLWDLDDGSSRELQPCRGGIPSVGTTPDSRTALVVTDPTGFEGGGASKVIAIDLETGASRELVSHGDRVSSVAVDPSSTILVTGDRDGMVRAGPLTGGAPHLLYGHEGVVTSVAVSHDGRWIASSGGGTIRLWPMPDPSTPPLHTLPHEALLAKLRRLTNLRVVEDTDSATGFALQADRFPGWKEVPQWNVSR